MKEQLFSSIFNLSPQLIAVTSQKDGTIIMANPVFTELLGYSEEEYLNQSTIALGIWPNPKERESIMAELTKKGLIRDKEVTLRAKNGTLLNCYFSAKPITHNTQQYIIAIVNNITELKNIEQAFLDSELRFQRIVENLPIGIGISNLSGTILYVNPAFNHYFGYTLKDIPNIEKWTELGYPNPEYRQQCLKTWNQDITEIVLGKAIFSPARIYQIQAKDKQILDIEVVFTLIDHNLYTIFTNVSEKIKAENELKASEQKFINTFNLSPDMIGITRIADGTVIDGNSELTNLTGFTRDEYIGRTTKELGWWANYNDRLTMLKLLKERGEIKNYEFDMRTKSGKILTCLFSCNKITINHEECLLFVVHDISNRKQAEEKLKVNEQRLKKAQIVGHIGYTEQIIDSPEIWASSEAMKIYGFPPEEGVIAFDRVMNCIVNFDLFRERYYELLEQEKKFDIEFAINPADGSPQRYVRQILDIERDTNNKAYKILSIVQDITDKKKTEEALRESERNYRDVFNASSEAMFIHEIPSGRVVDVNEAMLKIYGYSSKEEVLKLGTQSFITNIPPYTLKNAQEKLRLANEVGPQTFEWLIRHFRTKELQWIEVNLTRSNISGINRVIASARNIDERKKAEAALKKNEAILKATMESIQDGILVVTSEGKATHWNSQFGQIFDIAPEILTHHNRQALLRQIKKKLVNPDSFIRHTSKIFEKETTTSDTLLLTDGRIVEHYLFPLMEGSPIKGRVWLFRDVTARKKAEETLQKNQTLLHESQRIAHIGNWEYFYKEERLEWSDETLNIFGFGKEEIAPNIATYLAMIHPDEREFVKNHVQKSFINKKFENYECRIILKDGEQRNILVVGAISLDSNNQTHRAFGIVQDITERKKNEAKLQEEEAKIRSIFTAAPVGIALITDHIFQECNDAFYTITGYSPNDIIGQSIRMLYTSNDDFILTGEVPIPDIKETGLESFETVWRRKDGRIINILLNYIAIAPNDLSKGFIYTVLDITERKQAEQQIKRINAELEERVVQRTFQLEKANKDLEAFAYSVSHDLRAPLRHVDGFVRLLYSNIETPTESINNYFEKINTASRRMSKMIDDLLSFSRLGRRELVESDVDLNALILEIIEQFKPDISNRTIEWNIQPLPRVRGDKSLLYLAFANLLSNAIKYTSTKPKAIIAIGTLHNTPKSSEIFIKDNGVGFDMAYIDKLFGVFQRLHSSDEFEGTGIGLANVKQIIIKHGGTIKAEGKVNEGAIFFISLPK